MGCVLGHKSLWVLVQHSCYGRPHLGAAVMSFNNSVFVVKMSNMSVDTDQYYRCSLVYQKRPLKGSKCKTVFGREKAKQGDLPFQLHVVPHPSSCPPLPLSQLFSTDHLLQRHPPGGKSSQGRVGIFRIGVRRPQKGRCTGRSKVGDLAAMDAFSCALSQHWWQPPGWGSRVFSPCLCSLKPTGVLALQPRFSRLLLANDQAKQRCWVVAVLERRGFLDGRLWPEAPQGPGHTPLRRTLRPHVHSAFLRPRSHTPRVRGPGSPALSPSSLPGAPLAHVLTLRPT